MKIDAFAFVPVVRGSNRLEVKAEGTEAELVLIGAIGKSWWDDSGITEQEVRDALKTIPSGKRINARINSEGGSVKEGLGIYNAFKERRSDITAHITGYALSIASIFPLGAGKVVSPKSAIWMMHKAWSWNQGNADDMRQAADMLDAHDETLIDIYAAETGKPRAEIQSAMEKETWIKGSDAVAFGLADETDTESDDATAAYRPIDQQYLQRCKNLSPEIFNMISAAPINGGQQTPTQPTANTMNKKLIVALLAKHGIEATETETEEQLQAKLNKIPQAVAPAPAPTPAPAAEGTVTRAELEVITNQLKAATKARITDKVNTYVDAQKITKAEVSIFVSAMLSDEAGTIAILDAKESVQAGGQSAGFAVLDTVFDGVDFKDLKGPKTETLVNIYKAHKTPQARHAALLENYDTAILQACKKDMGRGRDVLAANTYSATLVTAFLIDGSVTDLTNAWAMLNAYSIANGTDPYKPLALGIVKHTTVSEAAQVATNAPTTFEPNDGSTVAPVTITPSWINQPTRVGATDLNNGLRMEDLRAKATASFADALTVLATAPFTAAIFTATPVISAAAAFGLSDLATLQGQLQKSPIKNLILDGNYLARVANTPGFFQPTGAGLNDPGGYSKFGWNGIYLGSNWTGAGANVKGAALNPQAIVRATGLPIQPEGMGLNTTSFQVPGVQVAASVSVWLSLATRTMFMSYDIIAGFKECDTTAAVLVKSA